MGCDIHVFIEVKIADKWHFYASPSINRNYDLFALLAGVRNYNKVQPIYEPRGFPTDADMMTVLHRRHYGDDGHTESWVSVEEFQQALKEVGNTPSLGYLFGNFWDRTDEDPNPAYAEFGITDARVVFFFDN